MNRHRIISIGRGSAWPGLEDAVILHECRGEGSLATETAPKLSIKCFEACPEISNEITDMLLEKCKCTGRLGAIATSYFIDAFGACEKREEILEALLENSKGASDACLSVLQLFSRLQASYPEAIDRMMVAAFFVLSGEDGRICEETQREGDVNSGLQEEDFQILCGLWMTRFLASHIKERGTRTKITIAVRLLTKTNPALATSQIVSAHSCERKSTG